MILHNYESAQYAAKGPCCVDKRSDIYQWFLMGELARAQDSEWKRQELLDAIPGAGPFWVFRSTIRRLGREQSCSKFRKQALQN